MSIYKAYDVRGIYPSELDEATARKIGAAFTGIVGAKSLVVGRDMRTMAPKMLEAFVDGASGAGASVVDIGLASTPMAYYAIGSLGVDGGAQITASHNPGNYIGFKFCRKGCIPVSGETGIKELEKLVTSAKVDVRPRSGPVERKDLAAAYADHVVKFGPGIKKLKVIIDAGNGMAGYTVPKILERIPIEAERMFFELDGNFPNHEANPMKHETLTQLIARVKATRADLGVAFDGDADRCVFVDETGAAVPSDATTAIFARELLKTEKGGRVVYDLRSSRAVAEIVKEEGGVPIRERVGHSFIKATMRKETAVFGGELSGHYYFRDHFYSDSGEIAMVLMLSILSRYGKPLSELVKPTRRYVATGELNFHVADKDAVLAELKRKYAGGQIDELDGVTVQFKEWWFNVRKSNTEPLLRLTLEADTQARLAEKKQELLPFLGTPE